MWVLRILGITNPNYYYLLVLRSSIIFFSFTVVEGVSGNEERNQTGEDINFSLSYGFGSSKITLSSKDTLRSSAPVVLNTTSSKVRIECRAPYPIDLTFDGHKTNREITITTHRNTSHFSIVAETPAHEQATGNYSCFSIGNPKRRSSLYIYVAPNLPSILLNRGRVIVVQPNSVKQQILIPCPTSQPERSSLISLSKKIDDEENGLSDWEPLSHASYDPTLGFFILNDPHSPGTYNCSSGLNNEDQLLVIVRPYEVFRVQPSQEKWQFKVRETFKGKCESTSEIRIHSQMGLKAVKNNSIFTNSTSSYILEFETQALNKSNHNQHITCETLDSDDPTPKIWTWTLQLNSGNHTNNGRNSPVMEACQRMHHGVLKFYECNSWTECQMRRCQQFDNLCESDEETRNLPDGILQCMSNSTEPVSMIYFKGLSTNNTITEWKKSPINDFLTLQVGIANNSQQFPPFSFNDSKTLQTAPKLSFKFVCQGSRFVFTSDFIWKITRQPSSGPEITTEIPGRDLFGQTTSVISSVFTTTAIPKDLKEISCEARVWNTTGSETVRMRRDEVFLKLGVKNQNRKSSGHILVMKSLLLYGTSIFILFAWFW